MSSGNPACKPYVIAVAAVSGGGKTSVVTALKERLPNAAALYFDDYDFQWPGSFAEWMERGADYNEWKLRPLADDLKLLLDGAERPDYILLDYPFAYVHNELKSSIDYAIFIDTPLDVAMARRIIRDYRESSGMELASDMKGYLADGRKAYLQMLNVVLPSSDVSVDGTLPLNEITEILLGRLYTLRSERSEGYDNHEGS